MSSRQIASSTLWQIASQVTMAALSIATVKFVAIGLTKELAGSYNSAYGFLQLFGILADFGLYAVSVREVSRSDRREDVLGALLVLRSIILVLSLGIALLIAWLIPSWQATPLPLGITIAAFVPFFTLLAGILRTVFQVSYKMQYVFIAEVVQRIFTAGAIGYLVLSYDLRGSSNLTMYYAFLAIGGFGALILFLISAVSGSWFMRIRPCFDKKLLLHLLQSAAPFGIAFLCMALYRNLDITLIALLRDDFEIQNAYYGFVLRMAEMGYLIPTFLLNSTLPILSERDSKGEDTSKLLGKTMLILLLIGSVSLLFSLLWARPLVLLLTTGAYLSANGQPGSDTALQLLSIPMFLNGLVAYCFYVLLTKHRWQVLVRSLLIGAVLALVCNWLLIPTRGFVGAGLTAIVIHVVLVLLLLPVTRKLMPIALGRRAILSWLQFSVMTGGVLFITRPLLTSEIHTAIGLLLMGLALIAISYISGIHRLLRA